MARSLSPARMAKNSQGPGDSTTISINVVDFTRYRDAYISGLVNLENTAHELSRRFIKDTSELMGTGNISAIDLLKFANPLGDNGILARGNGVTPGPLSDPTRTKKPKRPHDKNAPTKAMTPFFLYMQTERPKIQKMMGPDYKSREVELEGQKRWKNIGEAEKAAVAYRYACNRAAYYEKMRAYKAGHPIPEISQEEAERLYEEQKMSGHLQKPPMMPVTEETGDSDSETSSESDESVHRSPSPIKVASPRSSKRRKTTKEGAEKMSSPVKSVPIKEAEKPKATIESPAIERPSKSPEVERKKRSSKRKEEREADNMVDSLIDSVPFKSASQDAVKKDKKKGKKRKSEAVVED